MFDMVHLISKCSAICLFLGIEHCLTEMDSHKFLILQPYWDWYMVECERYCNCFTGEGYIWHQQWWSPSVKVIYSYEALYSC